MFPRSATAAAILALAIAGPAVAEPVLKRVPVGVAVGDVTTLEIAGDVRTVVVANPEIADASVTTPRKLMLLGKKPGYTTLVVMGADGVPLLNATVMVTPEEMGALTVDRGLKETNMTCTPRCVTTEAAKDTSGGASPAPQPPIPPLSAAPPAPPAAPSSSGTPGGGAPPLPPPNIPINQ